MYAKKSLGQNFLKSKSALLSIIKAGEVTSDDTVLEIGPGRGALTEEILKAGAKLIAIEKDRELIPFLETKFNKEIKAKQLILIEGDILELDMATIIKSSKLKSSTYKLIANIPYYITGEIIRKFFEEKLSPKLMVLLVQKEVAERIVAKDNKESILSIACKAYATPKIVTKVSRGAFNPAPNVDSAVISFTNISKKLFPTNESESNFFEIMKAGFAHKRKKLGGNLKGFESKLNQEFLKKIRDKRAEELSVDDWIKLSNK